MSAIGGLLNRLFGHDVFAQCAIGAQHLSLGVARAEQSVR